MVRTLDLVELGTIAFHPVDTDSFRCLALARSAAEAGGAAPTVLVAANEVAVQLFLSESVAFLEIDRIVADVLDQLGPEAAPQSLHDVEDLIARARQVAVETASGMMRA
jgi:1-deoxy-D-xylulose-5-phosphate reductoisomerase